MTTIAPSLPKNLTLTASLDIQAAESANRFPKFSLVANTGQPMRIEGYQFPVIIDLAGATWKKKKTPVIADHDPTRRIGHTLAQRIDQNGIFAEGIVSSMSRVAKLITADLREGYPFEVSVGSDIDEVYFLEEESSAKINGKQFQGPLIVAKRVTIRELSIVVLGADADTSATLAASRTLNKNEEPMSTDIQATREKLAAEELRVDSIRSIAAKYSNLEEVEFEGRKLSLSQAKAECIAKGHSADFFELACIRSGYPRQDKAPTFRATREYVSAEALQAVLMKRAGFGYIAEKCFKDQPRVLEAADTLRHLTLSDFCRISLEAQGKEVPASRTEMVHKAMLTAGDGGFSTLSLSNLLGGSADKLLGVAFQEAGATWRSFAKIVDIPNFRSHTIISPYAAGQLEKVPGDGVISHQSLLEDTSSLKIDTYGSMLRLDRQTIINDDLGWLDNIFSIFAVQAARKLSDLVYEVILGNAGNFFHDDNANYISGAGGALTKATLASAIEKIRKQRDGASNDLDFVPKVLVVPPELEVIGKEILNSIEVEQTEANTPRGNALLKALNLEVESRLSNSAKFSNASLTAWYVFCGPEAGAVNVGFLDGAQGPRVEFFGLDHIADRLSVAYRVYADYGAALGQYRAACKSTGEAAQ